jgi:hypothetical protein
MASTTGFLQSSKSNFQLSAHPKVRSAINFCLRFKNPTVVPFDLHSKSVLNIA